MKIEMKISDVKGIADLQKEFNRAFPFLKIEFFKKRHAVGKPSARAEMISSRLKIKDARTRHSEGVAHISSHMSVSEIENLFWEQFGLSVQVFRKSGMTWLETTATDSWTLAKQNKQGQDLSGFKSEVKTEEFDNDRTK